MTKLAILDDYQNVVLNLADWERLPDDIEITVFNDHLMDESDVGERLAEFEIVLMIRERTPFPGSLIGKLPKLKLLMTTGLHNASIDVAAATAAGITVCGTGSLNNSTPELTWGLILSLFRSIPREDRNVREGRWQTTIGRGLKQSVLGIVGLGRLGTPVAEVGLAFGMNVIAWSPNLTQKRADEVGVTCVSKAELFSQADVITIHMPLSDRSRGLIGAEDLERMKPTGYLVNTSRGPIVDEDALLERLRERAIAGAGLDVYGIEPLPVDHPIRAMENTVLTPHLGYVTEEAYRVNFAGAVENIEAWLKGEPLRVIEA